MNLTKPAAWLDFRQSGRTRPDDNLTETVREGVRRAQQFHQVSQAAASAQIRGVDADAYQDAYNLVRTQQSNANYPLTERDRIFLAPQLEQRQSK